MTFAIFYTPLISQHFNAAIVVDEAVIGRG
jgi:hypothetical protein